MHNRISSVARVTDLMIEDMHHVLHCTIQYKWLIITSLSIDSSLITVYCLNDNSNIKQVIRILMQSIKVSVLI